MSLPSRLNAGIFLFICDGFVGHCTYRKVLQFDVRNMKLLVLARPKLILFLSDSLSTHALSYAPRDLRLTTALIPHYHLHRLYISTLYRG